MKRMVTFMLAALLMVAAVGCGAGNGSAPAENPFKDKPLETILEELYAGVDGELPILETMEVTAENEQYYLGTTGLDFKEAIASEPAISAFAFSVVLVRMNEGADIEAAKASIRENVDPRKWICAGVDPQNVAVDSAGDVIILIMSDDYVTELQASFQNLAK